MSYETFPLTPQFAILEQATYQAIRSDFEIGPSQMRAIAPRPRRVWQLRWTAATPDQAEILRSFARDMVGPVTPFYYTPSDPIPRPYQAPVASQVAGGALTQGVARICGYTWADSSANETTVSYRQDTFTPSENYLLTVTVPDFPASVERAYVYVGISAADLKQQSTYITTSGGTWTEPTSGYATGGSNPPSTNGLTETLLVHFNDLSISVSKENAIWYTMSCALEEWTA